MKLQVASLAILLCLTTPFLAQSGPAQNPPTLTAEVTVPPDKQAEAKLVLVAPHSCRIGELVRLDASQSSATSFKWRVIPGTDDFEAYDAGARAVFSARVAGEYKIIVGCGAKDGSVDVVVHILKVLGPPPMPQSDNLTDWIPYWNWNLDLPRAEIEAIADSFEEIAANADESDDIGDFIKATAKASRKVLGDRVEVWKPILDKVGANLSEKAETGAMTSTEECREEWRRVAEGLRNCL
jgi:hypothetical protein